MSRRTNRGSGAAGSMSRRGFLGMAGAGAAASALAGCGLATGERSGVVVTSRLPLPKPFTVPLPVPDVARPDGGGSAYRLVQRAAEVEIIPGTRTEVWGYDGTFPGPTFDVRRGRPISVAITNELRVPTSTHLHGGVTPPEFDGYPTHLVVPAKHAGRFDPATMARMGGDPATWKLTTGTYVHEYPLDQPAATLWYHDHRMDFTGPQVYRGLAGMFVVRDDVDDALPLPKGHREIPLLICDRAFNEDASFRYPSIDPSLLREPGVARRHHQGVEGDVILVNGAPWPELEVEAVRYRFRMLNASNARRYRLRLDPPPPGGRPFVQVGSDAGLLGRPQRLERVVLAGGERADVVVDFGAYPVGTRVTVVNELDTGPAGHVMRFRVARRGKEDSHVPARLADVGPPVAARAVRRRRFDFRLSGPGRHGAVWTINGEVFDPGKAIAAPRHGTTELWTLTSDFHHPVHVHLGHFQVRSRGGGKPAPCDAGRKDTVDIRPYEVVEVLVDLTGHLGRYVLHCHNLEHEDMAMMANFDVV